MGAAATHPSFLASESLTDHWLRLDVPDLGFSGGGRPKARRLSTELTGTKPQLYEIFGLGKWVPRG